MTYKETSILFKLKVKLGEKMITIPENAQRHAKIRQINKFISLGYSGNMKREIFR